MKHYMVLLMALVGLSAVAQKASVKKADALFAKKSYVKAAELYEQLPESRSNLQNLGDSYYNNTQMKDAARVYGKLFLVHEKDTIAPEYYFRYAHALMGVPDYAKADEIMGKYLKYPVNTVKFMANLRTNVPYNYQLQTMSRSTNNGDFGMSFYGDKVVFASLRNAESKSFNWNEKPYLDLYSADVDANEQITNIQPFPKEINTKTHESNATFSADGKVMYFSRTNDKQVTVGEEKFASVKLFRAEWKDGKWDNVTELPFNSDEFSTEHPVLTRDGKMLYFASDRPGGIGSFDIYRVDVHEDGTYSAPENLGNTVNTIHREQFPYISDDGTLLYFASDGHQGLGGLDIFMSKSYDGQFAKPLNLGETINSNLDDFSHVVNEKKNKGYFSSNRKGSDNLYSFTRTENAERYVVEGEVRDKNTHDFLPGTQVTLYDENDKLVGQMIVGATADYVFPTEPNKKYRIEAVRDFYIPHSEFFTTNEDGKMRYTIELFMECYDDAEEIITKRQDGKVQIVLENIYFDLDKWDIKPEAANILNTLVDLLKKYPEMEVELGAHTDSRASYTYNLMLSKRRAKSALEYLVKNGIKRGRLSSQGYGETQPLIKCGDHCSEQEHSINRRCEFIILK